MATTHPELARRQLTFDGMTIEAYDHHGQPWLTSDQVGTALGYSDAQRSISNLYNRNADEFTDEMSCVINLMSQLDARRPGQREAHEVRLFSPRGCWLLGMLARTDNAKRFRKWVLDVLEGNPLTPDPGSAGSGWWPWPPRLVVRPTARPRG